MLRNGMIFMYMYPVLREKESLIRKFFEKREEPLFQLRTHVFREAKASCSLREQHVYEWQRYQMERMKESSGCDYSMYKYFTPLPQVYVKPKVEKKKEEKKNDEMELYDLFSMMSP